MFYIEEILNIEKVGDESWFDIEGKKITRHYFESKDEMLGFVINNEFNFWNEYSHIDVEDLESNTHILPEFKFFEFDKVLVDVCKENGLSLDKLNGNEIPEMGFNLYNVYYDLTSKHSIPTMEQMKILFELEYLSSLAS